MKIDPKVASIISGWSLKEKVGQLFILAFPGKSAEQARTMIAEYNLGAATSARTMAIPSPRRSS